MPTEALLDGIETRPIVMTGAVSGLGRAIALRFAREGFPIIAGTRSVAKFESLRTEILAQGGPEPKPLIADVTNPTQFNEALDALELQRGTPLHFFPVAAGGMEGMRMTVARNLIGIKRAIKDGKSPEELQAIAKRATEAIKDKATSTEVLDPALSINVFSPVSMYVELRQRGHIDHGTQVLTTSSSISNEFDPNNPEAFRGPWFYFPVAQKERGVRALERLTMRDGNYYLDAVAPELPDTQVGGFIDDLVEVMQQVVPDHTIEVPKTPTVFVADQIYHEVTKPVLLAKQRKLYLNEGGYAGYMRPAKWDEAPFIPYL